MNYVVKNIYPLKGDHKMAKFAVVSKDECIACGACGAVAPDVFGYDDEGYAENVFSGDNNTGTVEIEAMMELEVPFRDGHDGQISSEGTTF